MSVFRDESGRRGAAVRFASVAAGAAALADPGLLFGLFVQRVLYRQLLWVALVRSLWNALSGFAVGWGKLARTGSAQGAPGRRGCVFFRATMKNAPAPIHTTGGAFAENAPAIVRQSREAARAR